MEAGGARATLDDSILRTRLRREFVQPDYIRRPVVRPRPSLISDVTERQYSIPTPNTSPQITSQPVPRPQQNIAPLTTESVQAKSDAINHLGDSALMSTHQSVPSPSTRGLVRNLKKHLTIKHRSKLQIALLALAVCILLAGGYVSYLGLRANHVAVAQAAKLTAQANSAAKNGSSSPAPSTVKPSASALAAYTVAPDLPKYLIIPKLGVDAEIRSVGLTSSGALGVPDNVYYTDWYNESALPGQQGAMLIDGHVSSWTAHGVFYGIKTLVAGDTIEIQRGDNTIFTYKVVKSQVYPSGNVNMTSAMTPVVAGQPGLNLITCTGDVIPGTSEFNERIVVYATLQQ